MNLKCTFFCPDIKAYDFEMVDALEDVIDRDDYSKISWLIDTGYNITRDNQVICDCVSFKSEEAVLFLLKNGADAGSTMSTRTHKINLQHILLFTDSLPMILALLSYGANPNSFGYWEYNQAICSQRWLHLVIYFFWFYWRNTFLTLPAPSTVSELHSLVFQFPLLEIYSMVSLLEGGLISEETEAEQLPIMFRYFFKSLK